MWIDLLSFICTLIISNAGMILQIYIEELKHLLSDFTADSPDWNDFLDVIVVLTLFETTVGIIKNIHKPCMRFLFSVEVSMEFGFNWLSNIN
jgi:hypothetical protein